MNNLYCEIFDLNQTESFILPLVNLSITKELNNGKTAVIDLTRNDVEYIASKYSVSELYIFIATYREIKIYNGDDLLFYGYVAYPNFNKSSNNTGGISVTCKGFLSLFDKRYTDEYVFYNNEDLSDIAWGLIDYTQSLEYGNIGITRGTSPVTRDAERTYRYDKISTSIQKLSNFEIADGFDFDIDDTKNFNVYYPNKGDVQENIILTENFNITEYTAEYRYLDEIANEVIVFGEGNADSMVTEVVAASEIYKQLYFLQQIGLSEKDVKVRSTLIEKGQKFLEKNTYPTPMITVTVDYESPSYISYDIGDYLKLVIPSIEINRYYRLYRSVLNYDGSVKLTFEVL